MGKTVSLPESRRITMGVLVTGSISKPRIFISTSIGAPQKALPQRTRSHPAQSYTEQTLVCVRLHSALIHSWRNFHHLTDQAVGQGSRYTHWDVAAGHQTPAISRREVQRFVLGCPAEPLITGFVLPFNH